MNAIVQPDRIGKYMHTAAGSKFWPLDPRPLEVEIETLAHHLATRCRYNGAIQHPAHKERIFYSVAEHSVLASYLGPEEEALERLLHDGSEAYNGDLIRPLKYDPLFRAPFKKVEDANEHAIARRFGLQFPYPPSVKAADEALAAAEVNQVVPKRAGEDWESGKLHDDSVVAPVTIECWLPYEAKQRFLARFYELWTPERQARAMNPGNP
ncbi:hypothetical protein SAMN05216548_11478 [Faunimonas pinastri]|uniref:Phosphohydrolase n=1 Tax=Faunimonas pinastri TaxID=1855383 RepID=A0A1H9MW63_9HYPH|nr:hypothetical protein [Faunimonas pinastri]SER27956.1 hypothetical protein SAMN05216548_11478 [Faunimonas pinastri]